MNVSPAKQATAGKTHILRSGPETVHWGYLDGGLKPALTIDAGDRVVVECVSGNPEWMPQVRRASTYCPSCAISINRSNAVPEITFSPARFSCAARQSAMYWRFVSATSNCARIGDIISSALM